MQFKAVLLPGSDLANGGQNVHEVFPGLIWYELVGQSVHEETLDLAENDPAVHFAHSCSSGELTITTDMRRDDVTAGNSKIAGSSTCLLP